MQPGILLRTEPYWSLMAVIRGALSLASSTGRMPVMVRISRMRAHFEQLKYLTSWDPTGLTITSDHWHMDDFQRSLGYQSPYSSYSKSNFQFFSIIQELSCII